MLSLLLIPFLAAMFVAVNMGASGTAPSFSAAYGSRVLRPEVIPGLFGCFVFLGAIVAGKKVALTLSGGILPSEMMGITLTTIVLVSVGITLLLANLLRVPQSTSQATVFALVGPAICFRSLQTRLLFFEMIPTWLILPAASFLVTLVIGRFLYRPFRRKHLELLERVGRHPSLRWLVLGSSCYVAFAIGSNNVANAAGPLAGMVMNELGIPRDGNGFVLIMILATLIIAPCFAIGSSLMGGRVMRTTGREIVEFGPLGASLVAIVTATLLLLASVTRGIPTSLVQMNTGAIIALGISKVGLRDLFARTSVKKLFSVWAAAPLMALGISYALTVLAVRLDMLP